MHFGPDRRVSGKEQRRQCGEPKDKRQSVLHRLSVMDVAAHGESYGIGLEVRRCALRSTPVMTKQKSIILFAAVNALTF